ncbi:MAG: Ig-like domain-containing protein [Methanobrevibacter sp.]|nr:Ig-like domain-containing protein [Methanobrevibacter sp.]
MSKGAKLFNFVRQESTGNFKEVVPEATEENIATISNILFNDAYSPLLNEFVNNLINRIGLTIIRNKSYDNPLAILKKGSQPLGTDIQDIYTNPSDAEQYQLNNAEMAKLLTITDPDTKVAYYRRNRKDMYTKTIAREALQGAFVSWDKFEGFIASITQSLYSGAYIDEFKYTKALVAGAYAENKAIVEVVDAVEDDQTGKAFVKKARNLYKAMRFPSSNYNAYSLNTGDNKPVVTWTEPSRIVFMVRADVMTEVDVEVLASAFNMDKTDFLGRVIEVDKFDDEGKVQAIIADEAFFQIYDNIFRFDEFYNARVMAWNEYLHVWETFAICPFANAVILATEAPVVDATAIEADKDAVSVEADGKVVVPFTVTPPNATTTVTATSSAESYATVEVKDKTVEISGVAEGSATITLGAGEGVTDTIAVTVTA